MQRSVLAIEGWNPYIERQKALFLDWGSKYGTLLAFFSTFVLVCILFYHYSENWTVLDCIYFITVTLLTVGYGDLVPTNDGTRLFTVFMIIIGLIFILKILNDSASSIVMFLLSRLVDYIYSKRSSVSLSQILETKMLIVFVFIVLSIVFGIVFVALSTGSSFITSLYWTVQTISTVGYGDVPLESQSQRVINTLYLLIGLCVFSAALCVYNEVGDEIAKIRRQERRLGRVVDIEELSFLAESERMNRPISKFDFVVEMLVHSGKIDRERDLNPLLKRFSEDTRSSFGAASANNNDDNNINENNNNTSNSSGMEWKTQLEERSAVDARLLIMKHLEDVNARRVELENERDTLLHVQTSLPFKYVSVVTGAVTSLLARWNMASRRNMMSSHGSMLPIASLKLAMSSGAGTAGTSSAGASASAALDDIDSGAHLEEGDGSSDDGRRLI